MTGGLDLLDSLVLEDGRRWGEASVPHQRADAAAVLDTQSGPRRHWLGRSRGYSKTTDVGALCVALLAGEVRPGDECYAAASDADQGALLIGKIRGFVIRTGLSGLLDVQKRRVVVIAGPTTGAFLEVIAADAASAWGLTPRVLVLDELAQWPSDDNARGVFEALTTALPKVPGSQLIIMTSAGSPAHWSRKVYEQALAEPAWRVSDVHGPPPWMDPAEVDGERRRLPESSFRRLFLNEWADAEDRLTTADDLRACVTLSGPLEPKLGVRYVVGIDLGLKNDRTVLTVAHAERRNIEDRKSGAIRVVVDRQAVWQGTRAKPVDLGDVEAYCVEVNRAFHLPHFVVDPWQAAQLVQRLRSRQIRIDEFNFNAQSVGRLAAWLHLALRDRALALPADEELLDELLNVRLRETSPGVFRMDHDANRHDDRAISLALCGQKLAERPVFSPVRIHRPRGSITGPMMPTGRRLKMADIEAGVRPWL